MTRFDAKGLNDIIFGEEDNDKITGRSGTDLFYCGPGNDVIT